MVKASPKKIKSKGFHLAGVVPLSQENFDFNYQWPDSLTPVGENGLSFLELAIHKCLCAGCKSIWLALDRKGSALIKEKVGDYALGDIKGYNPAFGRYDRPVVPIFYWFKQSPKVKKYDLASRVTKIIEASRETTTRMSKHISPDRYFVSLPGSIYDLSVLKKMRTKSPIPKYILTNSEGNSVKEGEILDFVVQIEDQNRFDDKLRIENAGFITKKTARESGMGLKEVFGKIEDAERIEAKNIFQITDWSSYRDYLSSGLEISKQVNDELISGDYLKEEKQ